MRALDGSSRVARTVGAPFSGALSLVSNITTGLATGIAPNIAPRRFGREIASPPGSGFCCFSGSKLLSHSQLMLAPGLAGGRYVAHWTATHASIYQGTTGLGQTANPLASFKLTEPVLLLTTAAAIVYADGGLTPVLVMALAGSERTTKSAHMDVEIFASAAAPANAPLSHSSATVLARFSRNTWMDLLPTFRRVY